MLAEDDQRLGKIIKHMLEKETIQVNWVVRGREVLLARLQALIRRSINAIIPDIIKIGNLCLNRSIKTVSRAGAAIQLTGREFQIFDLLAQNCNKVVLREVIIDRVWGINAEITSNNLDAYVRLLRRKIDEQYDPLSSKM